MNDNKIREIRLIRENPRFRRYPEYKESSVEWIGEIPRHWNLCMLKYTARLVYGDTLISENRKDGVVPVYGSNGIIDTHSSANTLSPTIIVGRKGSLGKIQYSDVSCFVIDTAYFIDRRTSQANLRWLHYVLQVLELERFRNSVLPGLNREAAEGQYVPLITAEQQAQIANFLDRKTEQIDELIRIKERRIELLQEQRTALINQAVTKGLDPNVEMKPSGIEWIEGIPKHWQVIPIKYTLQVSKDSIRTGPFGSSLKSHEFQDKGIRVYNQQSVYNEDFSKSDIFISEEKFNELRSFMVRPKDVLITSRGTIGKMTIVPKNGEIGVLHPCLIRLRLNENRLIPKYLWWYVNHSSFFIESVKMESNSTTIEVIYSDTLAGVKIPIPTVKEQLEILEFLNVKIPIIDTTISNTQKKIELLKEYRQSLISEAVTGKIDVRHEG